VYSHRLGYRGGEAYLLFERELLFTKGGESGVPGGKKNQRLLSIYGASLIDEARQRRRANRRGLGGERFLSALLSASGGKKPSPTEEDGKSTAWRRRSKRLAEEKKRPQSSTVQKRRKRDSLTNEEKRAIYYQEKGRHDGPPPYAREGTIELKKRSHDGPEFMCRKRYKGGRGKGGGEKCLTKNRQNKVANPESDLSGRRKENQLLLLILSLVPVLGEGRKRGLRILKRLQWNGSA